MIVLLATVVVVCGGIVVVAVGRGGQMVEFTQDAPPLELPSRRPIGGTDVALLRLPTGPWGYSYRATDDALRRIAHALTERDTRIAVLEQQVAELRSALPAAGRTAGDSGSPWFDRSASFDDRRRPVPSRTDEPAAIGAPPVDAPGERADADPEDDKPDEAVHVDGVPEDAAPQDDLPGDAAAGVDTPRGFGRTGVAFADAGRTGHASADAEPEHDVPEGTEPGGAAGPAWVERKAWKPGPAWFENGASPKPADPVEDAAEAGADEADEDWAFENDAEPVAEPGGKPTPSALGFSVPAPWPGDRLVATSHPRRETADAAREKAGTAAEDGQAKVGTAGENGADHAEDETDTTVDAAAETGTVEDDEGTAESKADGTEGDAADTPADKADETADGEPHGEGH